MIVNASSIVQHMIQIKNGIIINVYVSVKRIAGAKKIIVGILVHVFMKKGSYLKSIVNDSVIVTMKL